MSKPSQCIDATYQLADSLFKLNAFSSTSNKKSQIVSRWDRRTEMRERKIKLCLGGRDRGQSTRRRGQGTGGWAAEGEGGPSQPRAPECWNIPGCAWADARLHAHMVCSHGWGTGTPWHRNNGSGSRMKGKSEDNQQKGKWKKIKATNNNRIMMKEEELKV